VKAAEWSAGARFERGVWHAPGGKTTGAKQPAQSGNRTEWIWLSSLS